MRHRFVSGLIAFVFCSLVAAEAAFSQAPVVVAFGDSTTARRDVDHVVVYATVLEKAFADKGGKMKIVNAGIGGNTTDDARARFEKDVSSHRPGVVIIQFGLNDAAVDVWRKPPPTAPRVPLAKYEANLCYLVKTLKDRGVDVILMTPNPGRWTARTRDLYGKPPYEVNDPDGYNVWVRKYADAVRRVARDEKVVLLDVYDAFQQHGKQPGQSVDDLMLPDGIHPNTKGQALVAKMLLGAKPIAKRLDRQASAHP